MGRITRVSPGWTDLGSEISLAQRMVFTDTPYISAMCDRVSQLSSVQGRTTWILISPLLAPDAPLSILKGPPE